MQTHPVTGGPTFPAAGPRRFDDETDMPSVLVVDDSLLDRSLAVGLLEKLPDFRTFFDFIAAQI